MILRNSRLILQTAVQLSFVIGSIIVADTHVVGNIVTSNILSRLKIISSSGWSISSFLKIVTKAQSIIDMGNMPVIVTPNEYRDGIIRSMQ